MLLGHPCIRGLLQLSSTSGRLSIATTHNTRCLSNVSQTYSFKARAFPFALSEEGAIERLHLFASCKAIIVSMGSPSLNTWLSAIKQFLSKEQHVFRPIRIQAIYLPIWLVDGTVDAEAQVMGKERWMQTWVGLNSLQSYMPGFVYEPLSTISLVSQGAVSPSTAVPFTDDLLTQHGTPVMPISFSHTPFHLFDLCRELTYKHVTTIDSLFRLKPWTVKSTVMVAYPVLLPVYLAQYEVETVQVGTRSFTLGLEAVSLEGRILDGIDRQSGESFVATDLPPFIAKWIGTATAADMRSFVRGPIDITVDRRRDTHDGLGSARCRAWLNGAISSPGVMEAYRKRFFPSCLSANQSPQSQDVDWGDLRIREYTLPELARNRAFIDAMRDKEFWRVMEEIARYVDLQPDQGFQAERTGVNTTSLTVRREGSINWETIKGNLERLEGEALAKRPEWWDEWDFLHEASKNRRKCGGDIEPN